MSTPRVSKPALQGRWGSCHPHVENHQQLFFPRSLHNNVMSLKEEVELQIKEIPASVLLHHLQRTHVYKDEVTQSVVEHTRIGAWSTHVHNTYLSCAHSLPNTLINKHRVKLLPLAVKQTEEKRQPGQSSGKCASCRLHTVNAARL